MKMKKENIFMIVALLLMHLTASAQKTVPVRDDKKGLYGLKKEGNDKWVLKPKYHSIGNFHEGLAHVVMWSNKYYKNGKNKLFQKMYTGYIDETGKLVIPMIFHGGDNFCEGRAVVSIVTDPSGIHKKRYGYIDHDGNYAVYPQFDFADDFENGRAKVRKFEFVNGQIKNYYAYIDYDGNYIIYWQEE